MLISLVSFAFHLQPTAAQPQWRLVPTTSSNYVGALDLSRSNPDTVFAVSTRGLILSTNSGDSWDTVADGRFITSAVLSAIKIDPLESRRLYASYSTIFGGSNRISMTTDGGATWELINNGGANGFGAVIEIDPMDYRTVYLGIGDFAETSILRSTDCGITWEIRPEPPASTIMSLAIDPADHNRLYAAYYFGFFRSTDAGSTWESMNIGAPVGGSLFNITRVIVHPVTRAVYATCWPWLTNEGGVFRSTDGGDTWTGMNIGLTSDNRDIFSIAIDPSRSNEMYLCTSTPTSNPQDLVFYSPDTGFTWYPFSSGLPRDGHSEYVVIDTLHRRLFTFISTAGDSMGLYILDLATGLEDQTISHSIDLILQQNYPNPFNEDTSIEIQLPRTDHVTVDICDILGSRVAVIAAGEFTQGVHRFRWNAGAYSSGVYLCRVTTSQGQKSLRVSLTK